MRSGTVLVAPASDSCLAVKLVVTPTTVPTPAPEAERCDGCGRTPLAGELLHCVNDASELCALCFARLPEDRRQAVPTHRVRASHGSLAIVPRAA